jgi:hypothetical protein
MFEYPVGSGNWYKVNHESIISKELFEEVQIRLSVHPKTAPGTKEFDFTRLLICSQCGSGVTAEEKFKRYVDGTIRRYVYYHCTRFKDRKCPNPYIREERLIEELSKVIDQVPMKRIATQERLKAEIERFNKFNSKVLGVEENDTKIPQANIKQFAKYILQEGSKEEKRDLLNCISKKLYLDNRKVITKHV